MNNSENIPKRKLKKAIIISASILLSILILVFSQAVYFGLSYTKVYKGVYVDGYNVSNLSENEIKELLSTALIDNNKDGKIILKSGDNQKEIYYSDIKVKYDIDKAAQNAYDVGREGNIVSRTLEIMKIRFNSKKVPLNIQFDTQKVKDIVSRFYEDTLIQKRDPELVFKSDRVILSSGQQGQNINKELTYNIVEDYIKKGKSDFLEVPINIYKPKIIDVNDFYNKVYQQVKDAQFVVENNIVKVVPHVKGREIDKSQLEKIIKTLNNSFNKQEVLPVTYIEPKIKSDYLTKNLFKDVLATYSSTFSTNNTNNANRGINIRISSSRINGTIIGSGQEFSFNKVVGPRTPERGYKIAHAYTAEGLLDTYGGGVCQTSSTLYNAALLADLAITNRSHHMYTVSYVPFGMDATVSYGGVDLKFKNPTKWPIKIESWVTKDNKVFFSIKGTNTNPEKRVSFKQVTKKTIEPTVKYIDDPNLDEGKTIIEQSGMKGYVVDTYKVVNINGVSQGEKYMNQNNYKALEKKIKRGTRKVAAVSSNIQPQDTPKPAEVTQPPIETIVPTQAVTTEVE